MIKQGARDDTAFLKAMQDVTPLTQKAAKVDTQTGSKDTPGLRHRREMLSSAEDTLGRDDEYVELLEPLDELSFKRSGIQAGVFRNLRLGKYPYEARLEIFGMRVAEARKEVSRFIKECLKLEIRTVAISFGRAKERGSHAAWLKSYVAKWLKENESVQGYHSALKHHGGLGAVYVILQKSERKRMETLERHQRRMSQ
ncbi:DNA endonuclease SmrA [Pokkaliibacter sp. MBI-7]|uniref:DNA endonuclease SmrA n=1 Tax=Pokkaliibacter sp. MBI-7 TaxID=3040600 RepID=UPI0024475ADA|nr:DNA endonuclease SmrA [Pokkaliibacter sp. MBI-7]MDH2435774.1 DNA endonuclease SmrA [Pokkaliibacter sp. MBI-7]